MSDIVNIGDFALRRKREGYIVPKGECHHRKLSYADRGEIINCDDCGMQVTAYWVVGMLCEVWDKEISRLEAATARIRERESKALHLIAAQRVEKAWRSQTMAPSCPHCNRGIFATDNLGSSQINKKLELSRREAERAKP